METLKDHYAHWQSIMDRYESSDTNQQTFCEQNQIDFKKFRYYRWKLSRISRKKPAEKLMEVKLSPVTLKPVGSSNKLYLKHPSGIECNIPSDVSEAQLIKLIHGLLAC